ncbi:MAG: hypothetical protein U1A72_16875 [Sulfuritalea sp.]|nr:hypothetical protein [Sulfuritalea sp.]
MAERRNDAEMRQLVEICEGAACRVAERVVEKAVPAAIAATLKGFGIDADKPLDVQKNMAFLAEARDRSSDPDYQEDRAWTRRNRQRCGKFKDGLTGQAGKMVATAGGVLLLGGLVVWMKGALGL